MKVFCTALILMFAAGLSSASAVASAAAEKSDPLDKQVKKVYRNKHSDVTRPPTKYYPKGSRIVNSFEYKFRLVRKIDESSGFFAPVCKSCHFATSGGAMNRTQEEKNYIIIINYDLSEFADGDWIELKKGQALWSVGTQTRPDGKTYRKFTFNRQDVIDFLKKNKKTK